MADRASEGPEKERLIAEIEASRIALADDVRMLSRAADLPSKIARSLSTVPVKVATGSAVFGLVSSLLLGGSGRPARHRRNGSRPTLERLLAYLKAQNSEPKPAAGKSPQSAIPGGDRTAAALEAAAKLLRNALK